MSVHIGNIIRDYINQKKISPVQFAKMIGKNPIVISRILNKPYLHCKLLLQISQALNHDFLQYYGVETSEKLKKENDDMRLNMQQLEREIEMLKNENDYLKQINKMLIDKKG